MGPQVPESPFSIAHENGDDYATWLIKRKAEELVGHFGITEDDREDIEQDLALDLLERWPKFDPRQAQPRTFVARVVEHMVSKIIRHRMAEQRRFEQVAGTVEAEDEEEVTSCFRTGQPRRIDQEYVELADDVATVMARLPDDLRRTCELLRTESIAETARRLGVYESTVRYRIKKVRETFEQAGLRDYL